jgi:dTDP-glucose pyrophosphorylase
MKVIITMAGLGTRFKNSCYNEEKYKIVFHGKTLFDWSLESLRNFKDFEFIFVTRDFPNIEEFIKERTKRLGIKKTEVEIIKYTTRGQAETAIIAGKFFDKDESVIIYNTDTYVKPEMLKPEYIRGNGWIVVFSALGNKWSFVEMAENETVVRTTEKIRISDNCSIGLYYFDSFHEFEKLASDLKFVNEVNGTGEWYIAPLYNQFIKMGNKVYAHKIPNNSVLVLGTPEDLADAERRFGPDGNFC